MVAFELERAARGDHFPIENEREQALPAVRYNLFEWVDVWQPIVDCVSSLANRPIAYCHADIQVVASNLKNIK